MKNRLIEKAKDKISGNVLDTSKIFETGKKTKDFKVRTDYAEGKIRPICLECHQDLTISHSIKDRLFFKHKPNHKYCVISNNKIKTNEIEEHLDYLASKESERHKSLKNKIGKLLHKVPGVEKNSIKIDSEFVIRENGKRRPDVLCNYKTHKLVFEIQISKLPLSYILSRANFYKENGFYLIWILEEFDVKKNVESFQRDIKYLTTYQNFFKLNQNSNILRLKCDFKKAFISSNQVKTTWVTKSLSLSDLTFDKNTYQVYFYNFPKIISLKEKELKKNIEKIEREEREKKRLKKQKEDFDLADYLIEQIKTNKKTGEFNSIKNSLVWLETNQIKILNNKLNLTNLEESPIVIWIKQVKANYPTKAFLKFILESKNINIDVNKTSTKGETAMQVLMVNKNIDIKLSYAKLLFQRGYKLKDSDYQIINHNFQDRDYALLNVYNSISDKDLIPDDNKTNNLLLIITSIAYNKIIGYNLNWFGLADIAIEHYKEYWDYIKIAFVSSPIWQEINGRKKFNVKLDKLNQKYPIQVDNQELTSLLMDLHPEIYY